MSDPTAADVAQAVERLTWVKDGGATLYVDRADIGLVLAHLAALTVERDEWRTKALDCEHHPAIVALKRDALAMLDAVRIERDRLREALETCSNTLSARTPADAIDGCERARATILVALAPPPEARS